MTGNTVTVKFATRTKLMAQAGLTRRNAKNGSTPSEHYWGHSNHSGSINPSPMPKVMHALGMSLRNKLFLADAITSWVQVTLCGMMGGMGILLRAKI